MWSIKRVDIKETDISISEKSHTLRNAFSYYKAMDSPYVVLMFMMALLMLCCCGAMMCCYPEYFFGEKEVDRSKQARPGKIATEVVLI